jgi:hypothetical protein
MGCLGQVREAGLSRVPVRRVFLVRMPRCQIAGSDVAEARASRARRRVASGFRHGFG